MLDFDSKIFSLERRMVHKRHLYNSTCVLIAIKSINANDIIIDDNCGRLKLANGQTWTRQSHCNTYILITSLKAHRYN